MYGAEGRQGDGEWGRRKYQEGKGRAEEERKGVDIEI